MRILILDGNSDSGNSDFDKYVQQVVNGLEHEGHGAKRLILRQMDVRSCTGCFSCWLKTPGECIIRDDGALICREYINSDFVIFTSPIIMGFTSAVLKIVQDRLIPLILPYFEFVNGECHHVIRYEKYPRLGLVVQKRADTDEEDIKLTFDIYERFAINLKSELSFAKVMEQSPGKIVNAIDNL